MMAHFAGLSELVEEQTKKTAEMLATMTSLAEQQNKLLAGIKGELEFVSEPDDFIKNREDTSFVVMDATALWLKLRSP